MIEIADYDTDWPRRFERLSAEIWPRVASHARPPAHSIRHHLYVCRTDGLALRNHLLLRDHLRKVPEARARYAELKRRLAMTGSMETYVEGKTEFIVKILGRYAVSAAELSLITEQNRAGK